MPGVTSTMGLCTNSICHYWIGRILARIQQAITLVAPSSWLFPETAKSILSPFRKLSDVIWVQEVHPHGQSTAQDAFRNTLLRFINTLQNWREILGWQIENPLGR